MKWPKKYDVLLSQIMDILDELPSRISINLQSTKKFAVIEEKLEDFREHLIAIHENITELPNTYKECRKIIREYRKIK